MTTAAELLDWLGEKGFVTAPQVDELRAQMVAQPPAQPRLADAHALAKDLIQRDWLTPYQVNQILQGNGDSLIVGANRLRERIGEGAMGQVFKAWNIRLARIVAVKMIHKEHIANNRAMQRFRREMETASQLDHPNIVLLRDADEVDGRPYIVMEFIEGIDLSQRVKQDGPLPVGEAVSHAQQAALGLQHAFERGVIHRDIKPGNLLVARTAGQALVKILDFGLARFDNDTPFAVRLTHAGNILGTVDYIAPEQAQDAHTVDVRADLYGLGCTLFYLLTGKPPFPGSTLVEKVAARMKGGPPSVRALRPEVPAGLDAVIQRMMARQPEDRYATPLEAAQALAPFTRVTAADAATATMNQADLAAALAAQPLAHAIPITQPLPAAIPVVHAVPVGEPFAVATPVAAESTGADETFGFGAPSLADMRAPAAPATPRVAAKVAAKTSNIRVVLLGVGVVAVLAIAGVVVPMMMRGARPPAKGGYGPGAELTILPLAPVTFKEGNSKFVIVKIQRKEFAGPVELTVKNPPKWIHAQTITFSDTQDTSQFRLTVSFGIGAMKTDLRVVATAENLRAETRLPLTVVTNRNETVPD
ncbi:MAG: serine/threonine protein kinase [Gemmataceae bacterium]|nr:serine/threonine protein kinase [Gemmataceae bacterium]